MALKIFVLASVMALVRGGVLPVGPAAVVASPLLATDETYDLNPSYSFAYDVQDALTGDSKGHIETRANGIVQGQYNVAEPDGTRRVVDYTADAVNGFNAVVRRLPLQAVAQPVVAAARAVAAPVAAPFNAAPIAYHPQAVRYTVF